MDKTCFKCHKELPLTEFYAHPRMRDKHLNKCKECAKKDVRDHRRISPHVREQERARHKPKSPNQRTGEWRKADKRRMKCHNAVHRAVAKGTLTKQPCAQCGETRVLAHHPDYDKPLEIIWLCSLCHNRHHLAVV